MQHILIKFDDEKQEPYVVPYAARVWRDDQNVMWSIATQKVWWDPAQVPAVKFQRADKVNGISAWPGSTPAPKGKLGSPPDRRKYVAEGVSNETNATIKYMYDAWVEWDATSAAGRVVRKRGKVKVQLEGGKVKTIAAIDPEILNEPEP